MADHGNQSSQDIGYELSDIQIKAIIFSGVAVVILTAGAYFFGIFFAKYFNAREPITTYEQLPVAETAGPEPFPTGTRLQVDSPRALAELKAEQAQVSEEYAVISDTPEIYRIPVDVAVDLVAEQGLPTFPVTEQPDETETP